MEKNDNKLHAVISLYNNNSNDYTELGMLDGELALIVHSCEQSDEIDALLVEHDLGRYEVVFSDEYSMCGGSCNGCCNLVRIIADSYFWTKPLYLESEGGYLCDECAQDYALDMLEAYKNEEKSLPNQFDIKDLGLAKVNKDEYQNGWFDGMNDSSKPILKAFSEQGIDVWFKAKPSQFYIEFDLYVANDDLDRATELLSTVQVAG